MPDRLGERQDMRRDLCQFRLEPNTVNRRLIKTGAQRIVMCAQSVDLRIEIVEMGEIAHPDRTPPDLVLVCWADTAPSRTDLEFARIFAQPIEVAVERQDQRAIVGNLKIFRGDRHALCAQLCHFVAKVPRIEHDAVTDHRHRSAYNTRR
jgi:hypothetical protein